MSSLRFLPLVVALLIGATNVHAQICGMDAECEDGIACTQDVCAGNMGGEHSCENIRDDGACSDGDACTVDRCTSTGCVHEGSPCDTCGTDAECDDGIACTQDVCAGNMGGEHSCENIRDDGACSDGDACTVDRCTSTGCVHEGSPCSSCGSDTDCDDGVECTIDECVGNMGGERSCDNIRNVEACNDRDECTVDRCTDKGCDNEPISCNDNDLCTVDSCAAGACQYAAMPCDDNDACTMDGCSGGSCTHDAVPCDDNDGCTIDACSAGACTHDPVPCDDGDACTLDQCSDGVCGCAFDPSCAEQGCKPSVWKTNAVSRGANAWPAGYTPSMDISDLFVVPSCLSGSIGNATLLQALGFAGGTTLEGTAKNLIRAASAAVLNASSTCVQYGVCTDEVIAQTNGALGSCTRRPMRGLTAVLDAKNRLACPLDQRGTCANP